MNRILYIGNHLSKGGGYPSVAESMAPLLRPDLDLHLVSSKKNIVIRLLEMCWAVTKFGRKEQPIIIDVYSTLNFYYALIISIFCQLFRLKYICVLHGGNLPARFKGSPKFCKTLFGRAKKIVAPSGYLQNSIQKLGYTAQLIPNFIFIENYPFLLRESVNPSLLWVRAFDTIYNPELAIKVLHLLLNKYPDATLCMVGPDKDGSMAKCKELAEQLGVSDSVRFTNKLTKPEWITLSVDYDIFINTTNIDNTPVSVVEAMALGLPIVSTNAGGLPYLIENGKDGLLVSPNDTEAMVLKIEDILDSPDLAKKLCLASRQKAEGFGWFHIKGQWIKLLTKEQ